MHVKYGIISDVHGNLSALETALAFLQSEGVHDIICCGDVVGYGPWPNECAALIQEHCGCCVSGNHDAAAIGNIEIGRFNGNAGIALRWTETQLSETSLEFLKQRPLKTPYLDFFVTHGSPRDPIWEYMNDRWIAYNNFHHFDEHICWFGHSHLPTVFIENGGDTQGGFISGSETLHLSPGERYLINPGSVGQPRDSNWRLGLVVYEKTDEGETVTWHRLEYDVERTCEKMQAVNLPAPLYNRLKPGF